MQRRDMDDPINLSDPVTPLRHIETVTNNLDLCTRNKIEPDHIVVEP
jgi:hypothetical protein